MFGLYNKINSIKNKRLRECLLNTYCVVAIFVVSALLAIPIVFILYFVGYYIVLPIIIIIGWIIAWLIKGCKR